MAENIDFSNAIEQLQEMLSSDDGQSRIQDMVSMLTGGDNSNTGNSAPSADNSSGIDMNTVMKISGLIQAMNSDSNNPKTAFLYALKPFLKESRRTKVEQAVKMLKLANVLKTFRQSDQGGV